MNRGTMRTLLRRRINEPIADDWDDNTLNSLLDVAYALVLKQVRKVDPEALIAWEYRDTVAGVSWYEKPSGTRGPVEVAVKASASATDWTALLRKPYYLAKTYTSEQVYCHRGRYIGLFPAPTTSVTQGIQFLHVPTDSLALDTDVPKIEESLQYGVVVWASLLAKGESPEADTKDAAELQRILGDIPSDYGQIDYGQALALSPDVSDARARYGSLARNDIDTGR
jgi:hypothetical protein